MPQKTKSMDKIVNPERLVSVPFSKTRCGVDFYINSGYSSDVCGVLTENQVFKTDFFSFYFFRKANGYLLLNFRKFELHANMVLLISPHQQQEWHVDEAELDYSFLIFREDFMRTFIADKFFVYRLLYYYQTDTPPYLLPILIISLYLCFTTYWLLSTGRMPPLIIYRLMYLKTITHSSLRTCWKRISVRNSGCRNMRICSV